MVDAGHELAQLSGLCEIIVHRSVIRRASQAAAAPAGTAAREKVRFGTKWLDLAAQLATIPGKKRFGRISQTEHWVEP